MRRTVPFHPEGSRDVSVNSSGALNLDHIGKRYGSVQVVRDVSLEIPRGAFLTLLGPSGCGKTTILRMVAGFANVDEGRITIDGGDITHLAPEARGTGMVFQNYALFPHLSVAGNVGFGLRMRRVPRADMDRRVRAALELVKLGGFEDRYPSQLSGGQQQRVALARALAIEPKVLLLDEPLGALDRNLRDAMQVELRRLQRHLGITTVMVTHDQEEALLLSDRIAVMNDGKIEQFGEPLEIYDRPRSAFVARFMGIPNMLKGRIEREHGQTIAIRLPCGGLIEGWTRSRVPVGQEVVVAVRPSHLRLADVSDGDSGVLAKVTYHSVLGERIAYNLELASGPELEVHVPRQGTGAAREPGSQVRVVFDPAHTVVLEP